MKHLHKRDFEQFRAFYPFEPKQENIDFTSLFDFEEGWQDFIWKLHFDLYKLQKKAKRNTDYKGLQILRVDRSSHGGLHFQHLGASQEMKDRLERAEADSLKICEVCAGAGRPARMIGNAPGSLNPVYRVLCEAHAKVRGFETETFMGASGF